jgi:hypothetical protein
MTPLVTTRIYDPVTKLSTGTAANGLFLGIVPPFTNSAMVVIEAVITGVVSTSDIGLGIVASNISPDRMLYDVFDSLAEITTPTTPFVGLSGSNGSANVVPIGFRSPLVSKYVVLMAVGGDRTTNGSCLSVKWFFGFDPGV